MSTPRTVVVTGAAGSIGSAIVDRFLAAGDTVVASDVSAEALEAWRDERGHDGSLLTVAADVSTEDGAAAIAGAAQEATGAVDVLVNCAGHFPQTRFEDMSVAEWRRVIDINLTGDFLVIRALLPLLRAGGHGRIVNIGSGSVFAGTPRQAHYAASKGGVLAMTRVLARELGEDGITVNVVTPGLTVTPAAAAVLPESLLEQQRQARSLHRDETPDDVVGTVFFLASDDAAFITGQTLNVDGGKEFV